MMTCPLIFISHSGSEGEHANAVASQLEAAGIRTIVDLDMAPGDDFVAFIDEALSKSDYCLLLWSQAAANRPYVLAEYRAAFARETVQRRIFLLVGRLDDHPTPPLLSTRVYVDLFPRLEDGVRRLVEFWSRDLAATQRVRKPVVPAPWRSGDCLAPDLAAQIRCDVSLESTDHGEVYVTSELFDCMLPFAARFDQPAGALLERVRSRLDLPAAVPIRPNLGVTLSCALLNDVRRLDRTRSLGAQGVVTGSVLTLELTLAPFAGVEPVRSEGGRQVFRGNAPRNDPVLELLVQRGLRSSRSG